MGYIKLRSKFCTNVQIHPFAAKYSNNKMICHMRNDPTNVKNELSRHIGPTNVLFNGIPCMYTLSMESTQATLIRHKICSQSPMSKI